MLTYEIARRSLLATLAYVAARLLAAYCAPLWAASGAHDAMRVALGAW